MRLRTDYESVHSKVIYPTLIIRMRLSTDYQSVCSKVIYSSSIIG